MLFTLLFFTLKVQIDSLYIFIHEGVLKSVLVEGFFFSLYPEYQNVDLDFFFLDQVYSALSNVDLLPMDKALVDIFHQKEIQAFGLTSDLVISQLFNYL